MGSSRRTARLAWERRSVSCCRSTKGTEARMRVPGELIPITLFICIAATIIGLPIALAWSKRLAARPHEPDRLPDVNARLERMEHAIDSIAVEVERISEGQRFTTKLLAEREADPARALPPRREPGA